MTHDLFRKSFWCVQSLLLYACFSVLRLVFHFIKYQSGYHSSVPYSDVMDKLWLVRASSTASSLRNRSMWRYSVSHFLCYLFGQGDSRWCNTVHGNSRLSRVSIFHQGGRREEGLWSGSNSCNLVHHLHHSNPPHVLVLIPIRLWSLAPRCKVWR